MFNKKTTVISIIIILCILAFLAARLYKPVKFQTNNRDFLLSLVGNSARYGKETSGVVLIVFSEFQCPFCTKAHFVENRIREEYGDKILFAYKHLPLIEMHPNSMNAAVASVCAMAQNKFWEYADLLYQNRKQWAGVGDEEKLREKFTEYAGNLNLNKAAFSACLKNDAVKQFIQKDIDEYQMLMKKFGWNTMRVPTYIFGNRKELRFIIGYHDFSLFQKELDKLLSTK